MGRTGWKRGGGECRGEDGGGEYGGVERCTCEERVIGGERRRVVGGGTGGKG